MTYQQTLDFLYTTLPMFSKIGSSAFKKDLFNTRALCEAVGNPQDNFKMIHVAGTNGKGSVSSMTAAILTQAKYKSGLYTSPHIHHFGERIRINGKMISEQFVIDFVQETKDICERIKPSFFELTVAMAFKYFAVQKVDVAVIECGLGGRLDSTNIINPVLSIITNIGMDHTDLLGETLKEIAAEKAGIIKEKIPVVIGISQPETREVFLQYASEKNADIIFADEIYDVSAKESCTKLAVEIQPKKTSKHEEYLCDLTGFYQAPNVRTVITGCNILKQQGFKISEEDISFALAHVKDLTGLAGRWDVKRQSPTVIYDVAHNEDGIRQIISQLSIQYPGKKYHFVLGFVKDKKIDAVLQLFPTTAQYYFTNAHMPRALDARLLQEKAQKYDLSGGLYDLPEDALNTAKTEAESDDVIVVCGSFFVLAELPV